jgi:hypothetical protein
MQRKHKRKRKTEEKPDSPTSASPQQWQGEYENIDTQGQTPTLPAEVWAHINNYLPPADESADRSQFAKVCRGSYALGYVSDNGNGFHNSFIRIRREQVQKLLLHVIRGQQKEAEEMILADPSLLLEKGRVKDCAGRTIEGTALQMALGAKDVSIGKHEEMVEMIARYLNDEKVFAEQYREQFPEGYEKQEEERRKSDSAALKNVFAAIGESNTDEDCKEAIKEFKNHLKKQTEGVITTGYHFNDDLFAEALGLYDTHYGKFGGYNSRKNKLTVTKVMGSIEAYFTSCLAQAACDGFGRVANEKKKLSRSLLLDDYTPFFHPNLGESHFVYSFVRVGMPVGGEECGPPRGWGAYFTTYVEQKLQTWRTYAATPTRENVSVRGDRVTA